MLFMVIIDYGDEVDRCDHVVEDNDLGVEDNDTGGGTVQGRGSPLFE